MIVFGDTTYYIDLGALDAAITLNGNNSTDLITTTTTTEEFDKDNVLVSKTLTTESFARGKEIDAAKFDLLRNFIEVIVDYGDEIDTSLGSERALEKTPLSFQIAFNTLFNYEIIKEK